jgi:thiamine pyrophosphokinase
MDNIYTKAAIFLNGYEPDKAIVSAIIDSSTYIIGCDGGTEYIRRLNYVPNVVIGDLDSITKESLALYSKRNSPTKLITYNADKDFTDSELAIDYAAELGIKDIVIFSVLGSRIDHLLGNLFLIAKHKYKKINLRIIEKNQEIYVVRSGATIYGKTGDVVSLMPLAGSAVISKCSGLKYDLTKYTISQQLNYGISNVMMTSEASLFIARGILLIIHQS